MPLPIPNLDDRTFEQLVDEARALIPRNLPAWTDHNPSDPGVTLMELFAFLVEAAIYQINRVPERSLERFTELVGVERNANEPITTKLRRALDAVEAKNRAITEAEFERIARETAPNAIARANAFVEVIDTPNVFPREQIVKVIIVPNEPGNPAPVPTPALRQEVFQNLRKCSLITTRVQVVPPIYKSVRIDITVVRDANSRLGKQTVQQEVEEAVRNFLSPLTGGIEGTGWEFGRPIFRSELYQVIEGLAGVDHVHRLLLNGDETKDEIPLESATALVRLDELIVTVVDG